MDLARQLGRIPRTWMTIAGIAIVPVLGFIDYLTGYNVAFSFFYLLPVTLLAWYVNERAGFAVSALSALTWSIADVASGHVYPALIIEIWNGAMRFGFFALINQLLSRLKMAHEAQVALARTDSLTGCANRLAFYERMEIETARANRYGRPITIAYIDLDDFKQVNDRFGHATGDSVLRSVGEALRTHARKTDIVARIGGDEFVVALPEEPYQESGPILERLRTILKEAVATEHWPVTFSIGAVSAVNPLSPEEMVHEADQLMYRAKAEGKNRLLHQQLSHEPLPTSH